MDEAGVRQLARRFVANLDISSIRDDLSPYLIAANAKLRREPLDEGESGYTVPGKNGKSVITVNELESVERQRFTICHEIAHVVLGLPSKHEEVPQWGYAKRDPNEVFCDVFASELLMPYKEWLATVPKEEPSLALIEQMAAQFGTSFPAAASRYASLTDYPCAFVTMDRGVVRYSVLSKALREVKAWIPPRTNIPSGSVAHRLRELGENGADSAWVAQDIWFENWEKGLELCEIARHFSLRDTTTSLLWVDQEELPEVEHDRFGKSWEDDGGLPELTGELTWEKPRKRR
ncbi:ImmA/IrrE family metallo-endopeptidase [Xanthomonas phaseoli]|uniref:ImmA/IrrE family metallo-endopeptidase n=1 Tax=Xanthomonas phaseoli TaxID=1985254 RepID=UPI00036EF23E|nr:ImmA/IrrE family metallo-endopeptidase [Xanthomonas phaseoli]